MCRPDPYNGPRRKLPSSPDHVICSSPHPPLALVTLSRQLWEALNYGVVPFGYCSKYVLAMASSAIPHQQLSQSRTDACTCLIDQSSSPKCQTGESVWFAHRMNCH